MAQFLHIFGVPWDFGIRLILAAFLGGMIGYERESHSKQAGLKTHILVCIGSALIMIVSQYGFRAVLGEYTLVDPSRIAAQVVSGIGFLGAGIIFKENNTVKGLSTAAGVWCVAGVGLAAGAGLYILSISSAILILLVFEVLSRFSKRFYNRNLEVQISSRGDEYLEFRERLKASNAIIISYKVTVNSENLKIANFKFRVKTFYEVKEIIESIETSEKVNLEFFEVA